MPKLSEEYLQEVLILKHEAVGFQFLESGILEVSEWSHLETSWAGKLQSGTNRKVI